VFSISSRGSFGKTESYLRTLSSLNFTQVLQSSAQAGVSALAAATPVDSGLSANSWTYEIETSATGCTISWHNVDVESGFPVAIMLQLGYATGTGGYVAGRDYINPAIRPVFDKIEADIWKAVTSA
jgi:hypothetical protein